MLSHITVMPARVAREQLKLFKRMLSTNTWVYNDGDHDYNNEAIEAKLRSLPGGSVDLSIEIESGIGLLKINYPEKKNAMSGRMMYDLRCASEKLAHWKDGKAVILYGTGHTFCSGGDLAAVRAFSSSEDGAHMCMYMQNTLTAFRRLPLISVAFIEGKAIGGGAELLTACDFRLMNEDAEIHFVQKDMGLIPGWGGLSRLIEIIGREKSLKVLAQASKINSLAAREMGLVDHVVALSQKEIFHEIRVRSTTECEDIGHEKYSPDCSIHAAIDWLQNRFNLERTDLSVLRALKTAIAQCSEAPSTEASLKLEKDFFRSVWGAESNLKAVAKSKHG